MRGTRSAEVTRFATPDDLPHDARALLDAAELFGQAAWWRVVLAHALAAGTEAVFVVVRIAGTVAAIVPMARGPQGFASLTTPYTCDYAPLLAAGVDQTAAMTAFAAACRGCGVTRLDAIPAEWDSMPALLAGSRAAGLFALRFDHFGNWSEDVAGLTWADYLQRRPGALRETIRRRLRKADRLPDARFELLTSPAHMDRAAETFEAVYQRSWKEPEPFPDFNTALMRAMAQEGLLRFGLWSIGGEPVAAQLWVVRAGHAIVLKLAHDEAHKAHSPGTVLTALMLRHLLDQEHVARIDFGRGDDDYKQGWATWRRQRIGLLLVDPWRPSGALALLRHAAGRLRARLLR